MSAGYESLLRLTWADSWGTSGTLGRRGMFLFADNVKLSMGAVAKERDSKLTGNRESLPDTFSIDGFNEVGEFTFQPRGNDILMVLAAHFQTLVSSSGTYSFYRINKTPSFTIGGGSNIGTSVWSFNIDQPFGNSIIQGGTGANGYRFTNCIVEKLAFNQKFGEDLLVTVNFKAREGSRYNFPSNFGAYPNVYGSVSEFGRAVDWNGTVTIAGDDFDIDGVQLNFTNNTVDKSRIGKRGFTRFPFAGHWIADGMIDSELQRDLEQYGEGTFKNITTTWLTPTASGTTYINIAQPNSVIKPYDIDVKDGQSLVEQSMPYRAYPPVGTTGPSTIVTVVTGSLYGTLLYGF